jgi:hypothetical protein
LLCLKDGGSVVPLMLLVLCAGGVGIGTWDQMLTRSAAGREQQLLAEGEALVPASVGPELGVVRPDFADLQVGPAMGSLAQSFLLGPI